VNQWLKEATHPAWYMEEDEPRVVFGGNGTFYAAWLYPEYDLEDSDVDVLGASFSMATQSWSTPLFLTSNGTLVDPLRKIMRIASNADREYIVIYSIGDNFSLARSTDGGVSWTTRLAFSYEPGGPAVYPDEWFDMTYGGDRYVIAFTAFRENGWEREVLLIHSTNGGLSWSNWTRAGGSTIPLGNGKNSFPVVGYNGSHFALSWECYDFVWPNTLHLANSTLAVAAFSKDGVGWTEPVRLNPPQVVNDPNLYINEWDPQLFGNRGEWFAVYRIATLDFVVMTKSTDGGVTWGNYSKLDPRMNPRSDLVNGNDLPRGVMDGNLYYRSFSELIAEIFLRF